MRHALVNAQNRVVNIIEAESGFTLEIEEFRVIPGAERIFMSHATVMPDGIVMNAVQRK